MTKSFKWLCIAIVLALGGLAPVQAAVVVSSKLSSESAMLGQMIRLMLNANGIKTIDRTRIGATPVVRKALLSGEIDLYVEYTGNAGFFYNDAANPAWKDLEQGYALGSRLDYAANHIVWLTPAHASNAWALAVRRDVAEANHLKTMSDFGRWVAGGGKVVLACSAEFANAGTLRALEKHLRLHAQVGPTHRAGRRGDRSDDRGGGSAHQRYQHGHGVRHRRRHRRSRPCGAGG